MKYNTLDDFITHQKELLELEHKTEVESQKELYESKSLKYLENKGVCVRDLHVDHHKTGLYGRFLVTFSHKDSRKGNDEKVSTTSHKLTSGDIVGVYANKGENNEELSSGVISYVRGGTVTVAFTEEFDVSAFPLFRLMMLTNEVTYKRLKRALDLLGKISTNAPCAGIVDDLFPCKRVENPPESSLGKKFDFYNDNLDKSQRDAVEFVFSNRGKIGVIHGPPGTGKTTTIVEVVRQAVKCHSSKVLVCAPSNIAVDNLVQKLSKTELSVIRLGHPARVSTELQKYSLDAILTSRDSSDIIKSVRSDISASIGKFKKCRNKSEIFSLRNEVKQLRKELVSREAKAMTEVLSGADVILSTANSASGDGPLKRLPENHFDFLIIDEAGQAMEVSCWIPVLLSQRLVLVGDHKQLPPTIISHEAAHKGLEMTLLERVVDGLGDNAVSMLTTQYRMHETIMRWPSEELYNNKLVAAESVASHLLCDLDGVMKNTDTSVPLVFVDTSGFNMHELDFDEDESKGNQWEVDIIKSHVEALVDSGLSCKHIGVITPYNLQVTLLRQSICGDFPGLEVHSVDGFQGREKEAILISMVRSNDKGVIGFLSEDRRMNVALTRARRHLFVVGDSRTASHHPFLKSMCKYLHEKGDLRTPHITDTANTETVAASCDTFHIPDSQNILLKKDVRKKEFLPKTKDRMKDSFDETNDTHLDSNGRSSISNKDSHFVQVEQAESDVPDVKSKVVVLDEEAILSQIQDFSKSSEPKVEFPCSLSGKERALVHEIAEQLGLIHLSCGEGANRRIVVSKQEVKPKSENGAKTVSSTIGSGHIKCPSCYTNVPSSNYDLHSLRCKKLKEAEQIRNVDKNEKKKEKRKNKGGKNNNSCSKQEEDIDALIDSFASEVSKCSFPKCKTPIKVLGHRCEFCSQMFCLNHHQAEVHGCGDAAKIRARQDIAKYKGSMPQKMNDVKKAQVQNKLSSRLSKLEEERKKKKKES